MGAPVTLVDPNGKYVGGTSAGGTAVSGNVASGATDSGNPVKVAGVYNSSPPTFTTGQRADLQTTANGNLQTVLMVSGTASVGGQAINADGITASSQATKLQTAGFGYNFNGTTWDRTRGDTAGTWTVDAPSTSAGVALTPSVTTAVASSQVLKASAGNLYRLNVQSSVAGYVMVFNATSAPADGAVTPIWVMPLAAGAGINQGFSPPMRMSTGCTVVFSSTGPFSKLASATAFIGGTCV